MIMNSLFAHPIGEVTLNIDNEKLVSNVVSTVDRVKDLNSWQCDVTSSYNNVELNDEIMSNNIDLLEQVTQAGTEFLETVGWKSDEYLVEDFWYNLYENEHWQESHHHGTHDLCAIYYATPDLTPTQFMNPNEYTFHQRYYTIEEKRTEFTKPIYTVLPQPGKLVLFPGYMFHRVPMQQQNYTQRRLTIAFNFGKDVTRLKKVLDMSKGV